ncbi:hypothetical protein RDV84_01490 [Lysobacter yananisis]|uniref:Uncharacterized protein n=1 Tax=Lysobacter yananisis TaxID=1003114 RepID=A0ABY9PAW7_9GAMM|nr:hypothetical protein [Lysobacter yananisis]WMT03553.1 hypothetical protein RDV84_01490 [Lysobacter yananisis]
MFEPENEGRGVDSFHLDAGAIVVDRPSTFSLPAPPRFKFEKTVIFC